MSCNITHLLFRNTKLTTGLSVTARVFVTVLLYNRNPQQFRDTNVSLWGRDRVNNEHPTDFEKRHRVKLEDILFFTRLPRQRKCRNVPQIQNEKRCVYLPIQSCKNFPIQVTVDIPRENCTQVRLESSNYWDERSLTKFYLLLGGENSLPECSSPGCQSCGETGPGAQTKLSSYLQTTNIITRQ